MGASRLKQVHLTIKADTETDTAIAIMQFWVGFALSCWHQLEQDLVMTYLLLTCPKDSPVDGPLASFQQIETTEAKLRHLQKVLNQVMYQDELTEFRKWAKTLINKLITLNQSRNKLAHGLAKIDENGQPVFLPYFNFAQEYRYRSFTATGPTPSTVVGVQIWDVGKVKKVAQDLREGSIASLELVDRIIALFEDERVVLEKAMRMTLDRGLPYGQNLPENFQP